MKVRVRGVVRPPLWDSVSRAVFIRTLVTTVLAILVAFPIYWMLVQALQPSTVRFDVPPTVLPKQPSLDALSAVISETDILLWLRNSILVSTAAAALALFASVWGAYAISRFRTRSTSVASYIILTTQMMPPVVLMVPMFRIVLDLGLNDSLTALIIAYFIFDVPVTTWMLKSIFDTIPVELEEAAMIDGCGRVQALYRIVLPLARSGLVAAGTFSFITAWGEFLFARTVITDPRQWVGSIGLASFFGEYGVAWDEVMMAAFLFTAPPIVLFLFVQRFFVAGLGGGLKG